MHAGIRAVPAPACTARVRSDTQGQDRSKLCCSALCCGLQLPAGHLEGGDTMQTHHVHCTVAVTVCTALPSLWCPHPPPTCSCPENRSQSARHRWQTIQRCLCSPAVHLAGCKHSRFGAVETNPCPGRGQTRTCSSAKVTPTVPTENTSRVAVLGAPDDAKRDLRRATIRRASEPTTAYCDAFRKSIRMFLVPSERGSPSPRPVV